jgi:superfamily II DNA or RNA helicase
MRIPYVIDNRNQRLADVLNDILAKHGGRSLDIATAYFTVGGFGLIKDGLAGLSSFRLLLGTEPSTADQLGIRSAESAVKGLITKDFAELPFDEETLLLVEDLIAFLGRDNVAVRLFDKGFLHAKCYLFYADEPSAGWERLRPLVGIVGSSNFTVPGLTSNRELNLTHKTLLSEEEMSLELEDPPWVEGQATIADESLFDIDLLRRTMSRVGARAMSELDAWFEEMWQESSDFKDELIAILDASKFGSKEYTPYQVYMKALYEYFKDDLKKEELGQVRSAIELAEFQEDAVKKARKILARHNGVMIADSVGLGKTWIGKKLLEDFAYHLRQKALVICPASLRDMWKRELADASIAATILSQEELGREEFDPTPYSDADVILVDESHNFRNRNSQRYGAIERILGAQGGRGRDGLRKKVILLTATPINNDLFDLYNQLNLITMGDKSYFSACGIGDLHKYFLRARRESRTGGDSLALFNLLEEVVVRRSRAFIRKAYPEATIRGERISFPERKLRTIKYDLESTYEGIYNFIVSSIESLRLAPYNLEDFKKAGVAIDEFEAGREQALVGIFKSRYLKRFESSIESFRISIRRALTFLKTFETYLLDGKLMKSTDFQKALRYVAREEEEDDATPSSLATEIDESAEAQRVLEAMETIDPTDYDLRKLHEAVQHDVDILTSIWNVIKDIQPEQDAKLQRLKELLQNGLRGRKVLIFSYYKDTARYLHRNLGNPENPDARAFIHNLGNVKIKRMDSGESPKERLRSIERFAPVANDKPELAGTEDEIDILISTDVLSEGQNLQDCGYLVNYDLHWNPTRMVQRAGRIDRIGTRFDTLWIYNMFPDEGLESLLGLVESLSRKIADIDKAGFLDASVLGETVHPKNFNTLRRIMEEDGAVIDEEEEFAGLASSEFLMQSLREFLETGGLEIMKKLPDGIHSGLMKEGARGVFFYFQAGGEAGEKSHFWKYYNLKVDSIFDNRYLITNLISCDKDTPRVVEPEMFRSVFEYQEVVIESILKSVQEQVAMEAAPLSVDPIQQTLAVLLQGHLNDPGLSRERVIGAVRVLNQPMLTVQIKRLRELYKEFQASSNIEALLYGVEELGEYFGLKTVEGSRRVDEKPRLERSDLRLICFDFLSGG